LSGVVGAATSFVWLLALLWEIWRSHDLAGNWDGVSCCDPLDDIGFVYLLTLVPLCLISLSGLVVGQPERWSVGLAVAILYLPLAAIAFEMGPDTIGEGLAISRWMSVASGIACLTTLVLAIVGAALRSRTVR
jgi:hypothetical protein